MNRRSGFGWLELIEGILMIVLGIISFARPDSMLTGFVIVYGIAAIITGIADIIFYIKIDRHMGFGPTVSLVTGLLSVMTGFVLLVYPGVGKAVLAVLFPLWFIVHCIARLSHLNIVRFAAGFGYYLFTMIINIFGLFLGFLMIINPWFSLLTASYVIGMYLLLAGIDSLIMAFSRMGSDW